MAVTTKPTTQIVFVNDGQVIAHPEHISGAKRVVLALDGHILERRHHIKPFSGKRRLGAILPSLLEDSLLENEEQRHTVFCTEGLDMNKFFSLSTKITHVQNIMAELNTHKITPVVAATPLALGLTAYAEDTPSILVAKSPTGDIYAVACSKKYEMCDFRNFPADGKKWQKEALMTLRSWQSTLEDAVLIVEDGIYLPREMKANVKALSPQGASAMLTGLKELSETQWAPELQMPVQDGALARVKRNLIRTANKSLLSFWFASLAVCVGLFAFNVNLQNKSEALEKQKEDIFGQALPRAPMVDAELQMKRKLNELQLATGSSLSGRTGSLADQLVKIAKKAEGYDINVRFDTFNISNKSITMRGRIESLSEVDRLQRMMQGLYPKHKFKLLSAEVNEQNSVNFGLEGVK